MNKHDALKLMIRHLPGGIEVVAVRLGKAVSTLEKELRKAPGYKLCVDEAEEISCLCIEARSEHCYAYVNAVTNKAGGDFKPFEGISKAAEPLHTSVAGVVKEAADVLMTTTASMADNVLSDNELKAIERELTELLQQVQLVHHGIKAAHQAGKRNPQ